MGAGTPVIEAVNGGVPANSEPLQAESSKTPTQSAHGLFDVLRRFDDKSQHNYPVATSSVIQQDLSIFDRESNVSERDQKMALARMMLDVAVEVEKKHQPRGNTEVVDNSDDLFALADSLANTAAITVTFMQEDRAAFLEVAREKFIQYNGGIPPAQDTDALEWATRQVNGAHGTLTSLGQAEDELLNYKDRKPRQSLQVDFEKAALLQESKAPSETVGKDATEGAETNGPDPAAIEGLAEAGASGEMNPPDAVIAAIAEATPELPSTTRDQEQITEAAVAPPPPQSIPEESVVAPTEETSSSPIIDQRDTASDTASVPPNAPVVSPAGGENPPAPATPPETTPGASDTGNSSVEPKAPDGVTPAATSGDADGGIAAPNVPEATTETANAGSGADETGQATPGAGTPGTTEGLPTEPAAPTDRPLADETPKAQQSEVVFAEIFDDAQVAASASGSETPPTPMQRFMDGYMEKALDSLREKSLREAGIINPSQQQIKDTPITPEMQSQARKDWKGLFERDMRSSATVRREFLDAAKATKNPDLITNAKTLVAMMEASSNSSRGAPTGQQQSGAGNGSSAQGQTQASTSASMPPQGANNTASAPAAATSSTQSGGSSSSGPAAAPAGSANSPAGPNAPQATTPPPAGPTATPPPTPPASPSTPVTPSPTTPMPATATAASPTPPTPVAAPLLTPEQIELQKTLEKMLQEIYSQSTAEELKPKDLKERIRKLESEVRKLPGQDPLIIEGAIRIIGGENNATVHADIASGIASGRKAEITHAINELATNILNESKRKALIADSSQTATNLRDFFETQITSQQVRKDLAGSLQKLSNFLGEKEESFLANLLKMLTAAAVATVIKTVIDTGKEPMGHQ